MEKKKKEARAQLLPPSSVASCGRHHPGVKFLAHPVVLAAGIFFLALALRFSLGPFQPRNETNFAFLALARDLAEGNYFPQNYEPDDTFLSAGRQLPLYSALIALLLRLGLGAEGAASAVAVTAAALSSFMIFILALRLSSRAAALSSALFFCFLPLDLSLTGEILPGHLFTLLTLFLLTALLSAQASPSLRRLLLVGLLAGVSALSRPMGIIYLLLPPAALALADFAKRDLRWRTLGRAGAVFGFSLLCFFPYLLWIRVHIGQFQLLPRPGGLGGYFSAWVEGRRSSSLRPASEASPSSSNELSAPADSATSSTPGGLAPSLKQKVETLSDLASRVGLPFLLAAGLGLGALTFRPQGRGVAGLVFLLFGLVLLAALLGPVSPPHPQNYLPLAALLSLAVGEGLFFLPRLVRERLSGRSGQVMFISAAFLAAAAGAVHGWEGLKEARQLRYRNTRVDVKNALWAGQKEIAADVVSRLKIPAGARILSAAPFFAYYCEGRPRMLAWTLEEVEKQIERGEGDYVVIDSLAVLRRRPGLKKLVTASGPVAGAGLVYRRYWPGYDRLVSVYQPGALSLHLGAKELFPAESSELVARAKRWAEEGFVEHARQTLITVLSPDPSNALARFELMKVLLIYGNFDGWSLDLAEEELMRYSFLMPEDPDVLRYRQLIHQLRIQHRFRWGQSGAEENPPSPAASPP